MVSAFPIQLSPFMAAEIALKWPAEIRGFSSAAELHIQTGSLVPAKLAGYVQNNPFGFFWLAKWMDIRDVQW